MPEEARLPLSVDDLLVQWDEYCSRLAGLGRELVTAYGTDSSNDAAETLRHLTRLLRTSLEWQMDSCDPLNPRVTWYDRSCAGVGPYGPNIDNSYLLVRVCDSESYRLQLDINTIDEVNISVHTGSPYDGNYSVHGDLNMGDLRVQNGIAEIIFSQSKHEDAWFRLPDGAEYIFIRFYYFDWNKTEPPAIEFECISNYEKRPPRLDPSDFSEGLKGAIHWLQGVMHFGHAFGQRFLEGSTPNVPGPMRGVPGGGGKIRYGGFRYQLDPEQALLIEFDVPQARYWSIQWQRLPWGDPADFFHCQMSLNHTQAKVDSDGKVRVIISHDDPGIANWLDTAGNREGLTMYRWIWSQSEPQPVARLGHIKDIIAGLPVETERCNLQQRQANLSKRRAHLSRRF